MSNDEALPIQRELAGIFATARAVAEGCGRADLAHCVDAIGQRLRDRQLVVAVAGDFKQGKSSLVNALVRLSVCRSDDDLATATPTALSYGPSTLVTVIRSAGQDERTEPTYEVVPFARMHEFVETGPHGRERDVLRVEVRVPAATLLEHGLVIVDCPGDGGLGSLGRLRSLAEVAGASALLFVSDATAELTAIELSFLEVAAKLCPTILLVLTKADLVPAWREVAERNRARLDDAGLGQVEQFPVSATLRAYAMAYNDEALETASGLTALEAWLAEHVGGQAGRLVACSALSELARVASQLHQQLDAERRALTGPEDSSAASDGLSPAAAHIQAVRQDASRWQQVLADGIADLSADIEHDLRDRLRRLNREADDTIDAEDPVDIWQTFEPWLYGRVADELAENFAALRLRTDELAEKIGQLFQSEVDAIYVDALVAPSSSTPMLNVEVDASARLKRMTIGARAFTALRGGFGGVLMASFVARSLSSVVLGPASIVLGAAMANKAVREEATRQLAARRTTARMAYRRYTDEVAFVVAKYSRDHLRRTQRTLRDHFIAHADEFERATKASLEHASTSATTLAGEREARLDHVTNELRRISDLIEQIVELGPALDNELPSPQSVRSAHPKGRGR